MSLVFRKKIAAFVIQKPVPAIQHGCKRKLPPLHRYVQVEERNFYSSKSTALLIKKQISYAGMFWIFDGCRLVFSFLYFWLRDCLAYYCNCGKWVTHGKQPSKNYKNAVVPLTLLVAFQTYNNLLYLYQQICGEAQSLEAIGIVSPVCSSRTFMFGQRE